MGKALQYPSLAARYSMDWGQWILYFEAETLSKGRAFSTRKGIRPLEQCTVGWVIRPSMVAAACAPWLVCCLELLELGLLVWLCLHLLLISCLIFGCTVLPT